MCALVQVSLDLLHWPISDHKLLSDPKKRHTIASCTPGARCIVLMREKALYHQIHPAKLAADILSEPVSLYFLWQHALPIGLATHFGPPILASVIVILACPLEAQRSSRLGRYIARHMSRTVESVRFAGDILMVSGAWFHVPAAIIGGLVVVAAAWLSGMARERAAKNS